MSTTADSNDLKEHYTRLYSSSVEQFRSDSYPVDEFIHSPDDTRYGITLLFRPDKPAKRSIQEFLSKLKVIEPYQYYYPDSDLHVTVMSIISCYSGFTLSQLRTDDYSVLIRESLSGVGPFRIFFRGITASPSCIMVQGFPEDTTLNRIRNNLRDGFKNTDLEHSIDKRYAIHTAHSTIFRVAKRLSHKNAFLELLEEYRDHSFGSFTVDTLELVGNDWYQRKDRVKQLAEFTLSSQ